MTFTSIQTANFTLALYHADHAEALFKIQRDETAMRYTHHTDSFESARARFSAYTALKDKIGYAPWTVIYRESQKVIGWGGLNIDPFDPGWGTEVAYFLSPDFWNQGFATEIVNASVSLGKKTVGLSKIGAFARHENVASIRVLEKNGFCFNKYIPALERNFYLLRL